MEIREGSASACLPLVHQINNVVLTRLPSAKGRARGPGADHTLVSEAAKKRKAEGGKAIVPQKGEASSNTPAALDFAVADADPEARRKAHCGIFEAPLEQESSKRPPRWRSPA